jgi:hypothetical protein
MDAIHSFRFSCAESTEPDLLSQRACQVKSRLSAPGGRDIWLAEISPPLIGQRFGLGAEDIAEVLLLTMFVEHSLSDVVGDVIPVRVFRILDCKVLESQTVNWEQVEQILWCELRP